MAAGLEGRLYPKVCSSKPAILAGCKWREDGDGLEFDLSQDLPGKLQYLRLASGMNILTRR